MFSVSGYLGWTVLCTVREQILSLGLTSAFCQYHKMKNALWIIGSIAFKLKIQSIAKHLWLQESTLAPSRPAVREDHLYSLHGARETLMYTCIHFLEDTQQVPKESLQMRQMETTEKDPRMSFEPGSMKKGWQLLVETKAKLDVGRQTCMLLHKPKDKIWIVNMFEN